MSCKYILMENTLICGDTTRICYGIASVQINDEIVIVLESVVDIAADRKSLEQLIDLCNELELNPIHLSDVLEDYLATL